MIQGETFYSPNIVLVIAAISSAISTEESLIQQLQVLLPLFYFSATLNSESNTLFQLPQIQPSPGHQGQTNTTPPHAPIQAYGAELIDVSTETGLLDQHLTAILNIEARNRFLSQFAALQVVNSAFLSSPVLNGSYARRG